jgi:hypothetical protein
MWSKQHQLGERSEILCGDGFMDFIHRPKSKILNILNKLKSQRFGSWLCFHPQVNGPVVEANGPNIIGVLLFCPSIHLRTEAESASETL